MKGLTEEWLPGLLHGMLSDRSNVTVGLFMELLRVPVAWQPKPLRVNDLRDPVSSCMRYFSDLTSGTKFYHVYCVLWTHMSAPIQHEETT